METPKMNNDVFEALSKDRAVRQAVTRESHLMFFSVYFPKYIKYPMAEFHKDIFRITEDQTNNLACIVAFRGSGKSTLVTMSYALWSTLGVQQKKFVLIICQTQSQARQAMANIRYELETNDLLKSDLGPFQEDSGGEWAMSSIVFSNTNARISMVSLDQSIRGIRHNEHRPDLIILDDIEDLGSTKTIESRNKTFDWFTREIVPLGDVGTRIILVGNLLHEDSLMMRLKRRIEENELKGIFKWFPLLTDSNECLWPGKFDTKDKIKNLRQSVANELAWQQEYLLKVVSNSSRVVYPEWIQYHKYESIDDMKDNSIYGGFIGVDLAISQRDSADYTAIVTGILCDYEGSIKILVVPNPINKRMPFHETIDLVGRQAKKLRFSGCYANPLVAIETNGFQEIYADFLSQGGLEIKSIKSTTDKRSRIALSAPNIINGVILFPKKGAEELIAQLTGFGRESHDDIADAFVLMYMGSLEALQQARVPPMVYFI